MAKQFNVAMVGLGFGAEFISIYQAHPNANVAAICRRDPAELKKCGDQFGIDKRYTSYDQVLADKDIDFVHINSPINDHAWMSLKALDAGKHVMCTVPMATTIDECRQIVEKVKKTGLKYMMAETVVYSREYLFIKEMYKKGELGKIQHLAASHPQDMDGWPAYWEKMIPMHYATHVVSPCLGLVDGLAEYVSCFGSGTVRDDIAQKSGNKFALETCHIRIKNTDLTAHIWRCLYDVARQYRESFDVYGTKKSFEWTLVEHEPHVIHTAKKPEPRFRRRSRFRTMLICCPSRFAGSRCRQKSTMQITCRFFRAAAMAIHPHLVHEMLSALVEDRDPRPNAVTSANWTCVGICAHESALKGGEIVRLPEFTLG